MWPLRTPACSGRLRNHPRPRSSLRLTCFLPQSRVTQWHRFSRSIFGAPCIQNVASPRTKHLRLNPSYYYFCNVLDLFFAFYLRPNKQSGMNRSVLQHSRSRDTWVHLCESCPCGTRDISIPSSYVSFLLIFRPRENHGRGSSLSTNWFVRSRTSHANSASSFASGLSLNTLP